MPYKKCQSGCSELSNLAGFFVCKKTPLGFVYLCKTECINIHFGLSSCFHAHVAAIAGAYANDVKTGLQGGAQHGVGLSGGGCGYSCT